MGTWEHTGNFGREQGNKDPPWETLNFAKTICYHKKFYFLQFGCALLAVAMATRLDKSTVLNIISCLFIETSLISFFPTIFQLN